MKIPKPPVIKDPELKAHVQADERIMNSARVIALFAALTIISVITLVALSLIPVFNLLIVPLAIYMIYRENKRFERHNDIYILKRYIHDSSYKEWYDKYII